MSLSCRPECADNVMHLIEMGQIIGDLREELAHARGEMDRQYQAAERIRKLYAEAYDKREVLRAKLAKAEEALAIVGGAIDADLHGMLMPVSYHDLMARVTQALAELRQP